MSGKLGLALIALALVGLALFQAPGIEAAETYHYGSGKTIPADTNGSVKLVKMCEPEGNPKWNNEGGAWVGRYGWKTIRDESGNVKEIQGTIYLNECRMRDLGYTPEERLGVIQHERGHARGWDHGEGDPEQNPAYHADYDLDR